MVALSKREDSNAFRIDARAYRGSWITLAPQFLELSGIGGGIAHGVLNVAVPEIVLDEPGVCALVCEGKIAGMAQHVGMNSHRELGLLSVFAQGQVHGRAVQVLALLTEEE